MDYNEFKAKVVEEAGKKYPDMEISIRQQMKNNGVQLDGLTIRKKDSIIAPVIYVNKYYDDMQHGRSFESIMNAVFKTYRDNIPGKISPEKLDAGHFSDMQDKVVFKVVSAEKNREFLKNVPHREVMDMAVIYYADVEKSIVSNASFTVTNSMMERWGVKEPDLYEAAMKNAPVLMPATFKSMRDTIEGMMPPGMSDDDIFDMVEHTPKEDAMYVLTNKDNSFGAAAMLYPGMLEKAAEAIQEDRIFILPSSVHEVLLVPDRGDFTSEQLREMVTEINATQVAPDEVLTDNVYEYDARKKELTMPLDSPKEAVMEEDGYDGMKQDMPKPEKSR
jgi:hypothetical protein